MTTEIDRAEIRNRFTRIELRRRVGPSLWAEVDPEDYELLAEHRWHAVVDRNVTYAVMHTRVDGRKSTVSMHVFLLGARGIDHADGNGLNNRRSNLRTATRTQNGHNRTSNRGSTSAYKGVSWYPRSGQWRAAICLGGKDRHLGYFAEESDAARAYDVAAREHFGAYARPNFTEMATT